MLAWQLSLSTSQSDLRLLRWQFSREVLMTETSFRLTDRPSCQSFSLLPQSARCNLISFYFFFLSRELSRICPVWFTVSRRSFSTNSFHGFHHLNIPRGGFPISRWRFGCLFLSNGIFHAWLNSCYFSDADDKCCQCSVLKIIDWQSRRSDALFDVKPKCLRLDYTFL